MTHTLGPRRFLTLAFALLSAPVPLVGGELFVGAATKSITPDRPVALSGQLYQRISSGVKSPVLASALAIEVRDGDKSVDQAVLAACDLVAIRDGMLEEVRAAVKPSLTDFDLQKIVLSATHTHTAPELTPDKWDLPASAMSATEYRAFAVREIAAAVVEAWQSRRRGSVGWGLGHAVVGQHRILVSNNGKARMYGKSDADDFLRFEGYEDHGVEVLCCWDEAGKLIATALNVACPAQEVENGKQIDADFWHPVREALKQKHGHDLVVLAWTGSAGDQSPHLMYRKAAEERMRKLRDLTRLDEISRRIIAAWEDAYAGAEQERHANAALVHRTLKLDLPARLITQEEALDAEKQAEELRDDPAKAARRAWNERVVKRFREQKPDDVYPVEIHVLRIGDVAIATNPFELYLDYGIQMKSRSPALQTFVIQLAGSGSYLPTARAVPGGAYGAIPQSNKVGPEGGRMLVEETLKTLGELWPKDDSAK